MKRLLLVLGLAGQLAAQWTVWDPTNYGINLRNLEQVAADSQKAAQYYQMVRNAAAFVHDPAAFLAQSAAIAGMAINDAQAAGWTTQKRAAQLQARLRMGQVLINESGSIATLSHGNATNVQQIAAMMQTTSSELAQLAKQMQHEQRSKYYMERNQYQDQGSLIAAWRLK